jgi:hypothetical protein
VSANNKDCPASGDTPVELQGGGILEFDMVMRNSAHGNSPADLVYDGSGTGNKFTGNHCDMSIPAGSC